MPGYSTGVFADRAVRFIDQQKSGPFFLYAAFNAPTGRSKLLTGLPIFRTGPTWYDGTRQDYIAVVERLDQAIGRLLEALDRGAEAARVPSLTLRPPLEGIDLMPILIRFARSRALTFLALHPSSAPAEIRPARPLKIPARRH